MIEKKQDSIKTINRKERRNVTPKTKNQTQKQTKKQSKKPREISIFTLIFVAIILAVVVGIYFGVRHLITTLKYKEYETKMNRYGYNEFYDNKEATSTEYVTNKEAIKVIIGSIANDKKVSSMYYLYDKSIGEDQNWHNYAKYLHIKNVDKFSNLEEDTKKLDAILFAVDTLESVAGEEVEKAQLKISERKLKKLSLDEQELVAKAVSLELLKNKNSALKNNKILKGELNKIVITLVEKFVTMQNFSDGVSVITDKENMPENYEEYPYILDNASKEVYEMDFQVMTERTYLSPKETFKVMSYLYGQTNDLIVDYFNEILNIDYTTITTRNFLSSIQNSVIYRLHEEDVQDYVNYVKENKIKLEGSATPILPIMYNNGEQFVVRTKIKFKVLNSNTQNNLLFGDENSKVKYNGQEIDIYVDVPLGTTLNSDSQRIYVSTLANHLSNQTSMVTVEE